VHLVLDDRTSQRGGIVLAGTKDGQNTCLVDHDVRDGLVYGIGLTPLEIGIGQKQCQMINLLSPDVKTLGDY
jgi:hypothetical protein